MGLHDFLVCGALNTRLSVSTSAVSLADAVSVEAGLCQASVNVRSDVSSHVNNLRLTCS